MAPLALKSEENNSADRRSSTAVGRFRLFLDIIEPTPRPPPWQWKRASRKYLFKSNRRFLVHSFRHGGLGKCFWLAFLPLFSFSFLFSLGKYFGLFSFLSPPPHFYTTHIFSPRLFIGNVKDALRTLISSETFHFREPQDFFRFFIVSLFFVVVILAWAWFVYCRFVPFFPDLFRTVFLFFLLVAGCRRYPWTAQRREIFFSLLLYRYFYCLATTAESVSRPHKIAQEVLHAMGYMFRFPPPISSSSPQHKSYYTTWIHFLRLFGQLDSLSFESYRQGRVLIKR